MGWPATLDAMKVIAGMGNNNILSVWFGIDGAAQHRGGLHRSVQALLQLIHVKIGMIILQFIAAVLHCTLAEQ